MNIIRCTDPNVVCLTDIVLTVENNISPYIFLSGDALQISRLSPLSILIGDSSDSSSIVVIGETLLKKFLSNVSYAKFEITEDMDFKVEILEENAYESLSKVPFIESISVLKSVNSFAKLAVVFASNNILES